VLLEGAAAESAGGPEVRAEEAVGLNECLVEGLDEVGGGTGVAGRGGVDILDTGHGEKLTGHGGGTETGTTGGRDKASADGRALAGELAGNSVGLADLVTPVATANRGDVDLGVLEGTLDGVGNLRGDLGAETDVAVAITDSDEGLEASALTGGGLLLDRDNLHDLVLEGVLREEGLNDFRLLDGEGEQEDLLDRLELALLYQAAELGDGDPCLLVTTATTATATTATTATTTSATTAEATTAARSFSTCTCLHLDKLTFHESSKHYLYFNNAMMKSKY